MNVDYQQQFAEHLRDLKDGMAHAGDVAHRIAHIIAESGDPRFYHAAPVEVQQFIQDEITRFQKTAYAEQAIAHTADYVDNTVSMQKLLACMDASGLIHNHVSLISKPAIAGLEHVADSDELARLLDHDKRLLDCTVVSFAMQCTDQTMPYTGQELTFTVLIQHLERRWRGDRLFRKVVRRQWLAHFKLDGVVLSNASYAFDSSEPLVSMLALPGRHRLRYALEFRSVLGGQMGFAGSCTGIRLCSLAEMPLHDEAA
ncbi:hypothetical protein [Undibacterium sp. TS12]|uniref:hypothetical protein n=1 Tax=Undibacterium sp. TS12 TaxID=2908202 RepID=UPI001F4D1879|nr:hypothetical protein [Undibacterium sp. TS12]MCH8622522.1 hypothetical protein [Undibacterium sp. TS12]